VDFTDFIYCDDQESISSVKPADDPDKSFAVYRETFDSIFRSTGIFFVPPDNLSVKDGLFNVKDVEIVLRHLFHGVNGHVVVSKQNLLSDSINNAVRHARSLSENCRVISTGAQQLDRSRRGQQAFDLPDDAGDFFLVREGDHKEFVALLETDHAVGK